MEKTAQFEKHEKITSEFLKDADKKDEARDASAGDEGKSLLPKEPETPKTKGNDLVAKAENEAKEIETLLDTPDEELDDEKKEKKQQIIKDRDDKTKIDDKTQQGLNNRFAELTNKIKVLEDGKSDDKDQIEKLKSELTEVKSKIEPKETFEDVADKANKERIKKYLDEDKDKPLEEKREMSKDELEEWLIDDYSAAQEWMLDRRLRRRDEAKQFKDGFESDKVRLESLKKIFKKHPELDYSSRIAKLEKDGKNKEEIKKIVYDDNPKLQIMLKIAKEHPEWEKESNGPELVMAEMEKQMNDSKEKDTVTLTPDELKAEKDKAIKEALAEIDAEKERQAAIDEGSGSDAGKLKSKGDGKYSKEEEAKIAELLKRTGLSREEFDASKERRKNI